MEVLLVDDNRAARLQIGKLLEKHGYKCQAVATGREALVLIRQKPFPIVFCDLGLSDMSGLDLARAVGPQEGAAWVAVTGALPTPEMKSQCTQAGFHATVCKIDLEKNLLAVLQDLPQ